MQYKHKVIDAHYHIYDWFSPRGEEFWETTSQYVEGRNFQSVNINALPSVDGNASNNMAVALYKLYHPEIYAHGGLVYPSYPIPAKLPEGMDPLTQYRELMEIGFDGIKMLETKPTHMKVCGRPVNDELYADFFKEIAKDGTHMVWHVADPETFWDINKIPKVCYDFGWYYGDGSYPNLHDVYAKALDILKRHPNLNVTFAHFFFFSDYPELLEEKIFNKYPNANVDLTPGTEMYGSFGKDPEYFRDFFTRFADRIEFGTDSSDEHGPKESMEIADTVYEFLSGNEEIHQWGYDFHGLNLDDESLDKIVRGNFMRRVSEQPKPINRKALKAYIEKYFHLIPSEIVKKKVMEEAEKL